MSRRIGLAIGTRAARAVALDPDHAIVAVAESAPTPDQAATVMQLIDRLGVAADEADRVVLATSALVRPLRRPEQCARVGVLRIGAPACAAVPPFNRWPTDLTAAVRGPVEMVRGGHGYDGRPSADLEVAAVEAFARRCRGAVDAVAVTAVHAQANRAHEELAARLLTDVLGPEIPVVTGGDDGGLGLLERENTAILDAALSPAARRTTDDVAAALAERGMTDELYLLRGNGTAFPAPAAAARPLRTVGALRGAAQVGAAHCAGEDRRPQETGRLVEVLGIRTNLRELRLPAAPAADAHAAAVGAAIAEAAGSIDRIFWLGQRSRSDAIAEARQLAEQAAIRAGADPLRLREPTVHEALMTYVPSSCMRIRVQAVGPILTVARPGEQP
jgi:hypothetical protein